MGFAKYDTNSIGTKTIANKKEVLAGINKDINFCLCNLYPIILMPIKIENDIKNVIINWLVIVKLYGTKPIKLHDAIDKNIIEMEGKKISPCWFKLSKSNFKIVSKTISIKNCQLLGTRKKEYSFK
jgi:hypothetical protein